MNRDMLSFRSEIKLLGRRPPFSFWHPLPPLLRAPLNLSHPLFQNILHLIVYHPSHCSPATYHPLPSSLTTYPNPFFDHPSSRTYSSHPPPSSTHCCILFFLFLRVLNSTSASEFLHDLLLNQRNEYAFIPVTQHACGVLNVLYTSASLAILEAVTRHKKRAK